MLLRPKNPTRSSFTPTTSDSKASPAFLEVGACAQSDVDVEGQGWKNPQPRGDFQVGLQPTRPSEGQVESHGNSGENGHVVPPIAVVVVVPEGHAAPGAHVPVEPDGCVDDGLLVQVVEVNAEELVDGVAGVGAIVVVAPAIAPEAHAKVESVVSIKKELADDGRRFEKLNTKAEGSRCTDLSGSGHAWTASHGCDEQN